MFSAASSGLKVRRENALESQSPDYFSPIEETATPVGILIRGTCNA